MIRLRRALDRRLGPQRSDEGFTLIELTVAMVITLIVVSALISTLLSSLKGAAQSKQRQTATGLATSQMEQFRAIDARKLQAGMYCADLKPTQTGHPDRTYLTASGACGSSGGSVRLRIPSEGVDELLVVQATALPAGGDAPLAPHVTSQTLDGVTYRVVTYVSAGGAQQAVNLTVLVTWTSPVSRGTQTVVQRSLAYSPSRCLSSATHPYAGSCQASFNADAGLTNAGVTLFNPDDKGAPLVGFGAEELDLALPGLSATLGSEQLTKLSAAASTTGVRRTADGALTSSGGLEAPAAADDDPSSTDTGAASAPLTQASASPVPVTGTGGTLSARPTTGDTGGADTRTASTASSCVGSNGSGLANALNRPCAASRVRAVNGPAYVDLALANGAPNFRLLEVGAAPADSRATVARLVGAGGTACPTATGVGCVSAQVTRSLGAVMVGGLPAGQSGDAVPAGWGGALLRLDGTTESAYAESGFGARTPAFDRTSGTVSWYDATTRTVRSQSINGLASDLAVDLGTVTGRYGQGGVTTVVTVTGSFRAGADAALAPTVTRPDATCKSEACAASATPTSTLRADLVYDITTNGVRTARFGVSVDLGSVVARSSFKAAFDA